MTTSTRLNQKMKSYDLIKIIIMISLFNLATGNHIVSLSDHCTDRRYVNSLNTSFMQFTKEIVNEEYAVETEFKGLHCCAKGYRSIEWWVFKTYTAIIFPLHFHFECFRYELCCIWCKLLWEQWRSFSRSSAPLWNK